MFCPNCGSKNGVEQNYCRGCGLKLDAIAEAVADQFPSKEYAALQRRRERFEKLALLSLSVAGFIGFALVLFVAVQYKLILFGPEILFGSAIAALIGFLILSAVLLFYAKVLLKAKNLPAEDVQIPDSANTKLIEDRPSDYVSSVTENTTKSLHTPTKSRLS